MSGECADTHIHLYLYTDIRLASYMRDSLQCVLFPQYIMCLLKQRMICIFFKVSDDCNVLFVSVRVICHGALKLDPIYIVSNTFSLKISSIYILFTEQQKGKLKWVFNKCRESVRFAIV